MVLNGLGMQGPPLAGSLAGEQRLLMSVANPPAVLGKPGFPGLGPQRADRQAGPSPGSAAPHGWAASLSLRSSLSSWYSHTMDKWADFCCRLLSHELKQNTALQTVILALLSLISTKSYWENRKHLTVCELGSFNSLP